MVLAAHCQYSVVGQCEMETPLARVEHPHAGMGGSARLPQPQRFGRG